MPKLTDQEIEDKVNDMHNNDSQGVKDLFNDFTDSDLKKLDNIIVLRNVLKSLDRVYETIQDQISYLPGGDTSDIPKGSLHTDKDGDIFLNDEKSKILDSGQSYSSLINDTMTKATSISSEISVLLVPAPEKEGDLFKIHKKIRDIT